jgi:diguanylate cyclase (GGDEF)-like protein/PAS domain S-box-containing protein
MTENETLRLFSEAILHSPVAVALSDAKGKFLFTNDRFTQLTGYGSNDLRGRKQRHQDAFALFPLMETAFHTCLVQQQEMQLHRKNGESCWVFLTARPLPDSSGALTHVLLFLEDVSTRKEYEQLAEHMAFYDALTDLPNRVLFHGRLKMALEHARQSAGKLAVILMDLDRFKVVNDTLGHEAGDHLIQQVAGRLQAAFPEKILVARMGGDEFVLLMPGILHFQEAFRQVQSLMNLFHEPFQCLGQELHITVGLGIALFPEDGEDPMSLLKNADSALYEAKSIGGGQYKFYTTRLNATASAQLSLETALRHALDEEQFQLAYQPQVDIRTGQILGVEALVRWRHPDQGLLAPDRFIALAEETGLIVPMGKWILRTACRQAVVWQKLHPFLRMAVNLSVRQFQEPELIESVLGICQETGLDPKRLELELTESMLANEATASLALQWLSKKGISLALDDFGTGYSSLSYLKHYPIRTLKIDRSFIRDCLTNSDDAAIVTTIISMAHHMGMAVVAEGVELEGQLQLLRMAGCDVYQGFLFSTPLPAVEMTRLLKETRFGPWKRAGMRPSFTPDRPDSLTG